MPPTNELEQEYQKKGFNLIAGLDEVGKGSWAGPMVSAAVILPNEIDLPKLNDSKLVSEKNREYLYELITQNAVAWGIGIVSWIEIDEQGLGEAHRNSMRLAVQNLQTKPDYLLVDGSGISLLGVESSCVVKGDQKVRCIAAASIIAKVTRDRLMKEYAIQYPEYGFDRHKGYGTADHQEALNAHGVSPIHRLSYKPVFRIWSGELL